MKNRNPIARVVTRIRHKVIPDKRRVIHETSLDDLLRDIEALREDDVREAKPETISQMINRMRNMPDDSPERLALTSFLLGIAIGSLYGVRDRLEEIQRLAKDSGNAKIYAEATEAINKYADLDRSV